MTAEETAIQEAATAAAASRSTNPWGPVKTALRNAIDAESAGVIGIQDSTVIDRAIGSPGMLKPHAVHAFVVLQPEGDRRGADLEVVFARMKRAVETLPQITSVVIIPHSSDFVPSHVLSCEPTVGARLAAAYPAAEHHLGLTKEGTGVDLPTGPWRVSVDRITKGSGGSVSLWIDDPERTSRFLDCGDTVVVFREGSDTPYAIGRLHSYRAVEAGRCLALDRYVVLPQSEEREEG